MGAMTSTSSSATEQWTEIRPTHGRRAVRLEELWAYRELVGFMALRDVKVRYKQAVFGGAWAIVQPLAGAAIFTVLFGRLADLPSDGIPYLVFAFAGFSLWSYFSVALGAARGSLISNESLITKVYFPRLVAPLASVVPGLIDLGVAAVVLAIMMFAYDIAPGLAVLSAPLFVLWAMVVAFGTGTLLAALTVKYRDVVQVFGFLTQLWLYATPVAYASTLIEGRWRWVYALNPMVGPLDGWRWALLGGPAPTTTALVSAASTIVLLVAGLAVFQRGERRFADII